MRARKILASACTFGPKIGSTKACQTNGRCVTSYHVTSHGDQNYIVAPEVVALYSLGQEYAISDFLRIFFLFILIFHTGPML